MAFVALVTEILSRNLLALKRLLVIADAIPQCVAADRGPFNKPKNLSFAIIQDNVLAYADRPF